MSLVTVVWPLMLSARKSLRPPGEMQLGLLRHVAARGNQRFVARPADCDAPEQVGLGARHAEQPRRLERGPLAENLGVRAKAHLRAAPVLDGPEILQGSVGNAARIALPVEGLPPRHFYFESLRQGVGDRHADAVKSAARGVDLGVELPARVQRRHDDFERRLVLELGMRIDRDAPAVVVDGESAVSVERDLDPARMARHGLVHRIVQHFGEEVMQRLFVGAAHIHARPLPDGLQSFEDLDMSGGVTGLCTAALRALLRRRFGARGARRRSIEQIVRGSGFSSGCDRWSPPGQGRRANGAGLRAPGPRKTKNQWRLRRDSCSHGGGAFSRGTVFKGHGFKGEVPRRQGLPQDPGSLSRRSCPRLSW